MKKFLSILLAVLMLTALVACDKEKEAEKTEPGTEASAEKAPEKAPEDAAPAEKIVIEFWHHNNTEPMKSIFHGAIERFEAANPNVEIKENLMSNDSYKQKIAIAMSSQQIPDVFFSWGGGTMEEYIKSGNLLDLTPYMEKDNLKDRFLDAAIAQSSYDGKIYGYPAGGCSCSVIFYNTEIFDELGLEEPKTLAELESIAETLKENGYVPFALANKAPWTGSMYFMNLATRLGGLDPYKAAVRGEGTFESDNFIQAGHIIQDWVNRGFFNEGFNGADDDSGQARRLMYTKDAAMTLNGNWLLGEMLNDDPEFSAKLGCFAFPAIEGSTADQNLVIGTVGGNFYHISAKTKHPDESFEFLKYLLDETSVGQRLEAKSILALKEIKLDDPRLEKNFAILSAAPDVQLWYDQDLPPEVAQVHLQTVQEIFGGTLTPEEAAKKLQDAMSSYLEKNAK